jgi:hypothetical protein
VIVVLLRNGISRLSFAGSHCLVPIAGLIFRRSFLRGTGLGGAIKG